MARGSVGEAWLVALTQHPEHLLDDLGVELRKQPAIQRAARSEKQTGTEEVLEEGDVFAAPLAHRLGTLTIA